MVGKSSLISTFVSRVFSPEVPGIMTRVQLPPDPGMLCTTTIIDSQEADVALMEALATRGDHSLTSLKSTTSSAPSIDHVDSIVLVYDLPRAETFRRIEQHWLPLIQQYYQGKIPVIIAENKMDLFDSNLLPQKRQEIISLMQNFPFVRQCIKCSAQTMTRVDDVWLKAQEAVLYPLTLYDLEKGALTGDCQKALGRIFRMYDRDGDGLLSDVEIDRFQRETFPVPMFSDLGMLKKSVARHVEHALDQNKFTPSGFVALFDELINQNRLNMVWKALRHFGYDDNLQLDIPPDLPITKRLSPHAKRFLTALFQQFDTNHDGVLSGDDLWLIFSILPNPSLPPWHRQRDLFLECFSSFVMRDSPSNSSESYATPSVKDPQLIVPEGEMAQSLSNSGLSLLSTSGSLPSLDFTQQSLSYWEWMGCWHTMHTISPEITSAELYRLGFLESKRPVKIKDKVVKSQQLRIMVFGDTKSKVTILQRLCGAYFDANRPETSHTYCSLKRFNGEELMVHLIFTCIPSDVSVTPGLVDFDLAMLVFDEEPSSWLYLQKLPAVTNETRRVYVTSSEKELREAQEYCQKIDVEPPLQADALDREDILQHIARCGVSGYDLQPKKLRSLPFEEQKRREAARRRTMLWLGGIVGVGVVVVVGVRFFIKQKDRAGSLWLWLRPRVPIAS
ncbi:mitochondrial Rho GTPase 1 [Fistulifera solaris]|uniref:Mitochondrial Rho GTPase 1 n=1 Tax=Fistulifera solaris TaxID=1519565 RepID=A0A1Z5KCM3_FISSO|nr:mitochondrial Rho GTPase 1 [Fistulifera solaris]|eukprot:GAX24013.1 mitochondrial Rho GTPase 1 [Fistulifera solaris]